MARHESKFYQNLKKITPTIRWTRLENWASFGTPDLLGYTPRGHFFTVDLKVANYTVWQKIAENMKDVEDNIDPDGKSSQDKWRYCVRKYRE